MGIQIDRNNNVLFNAGGKAHHTGYVLLQFDEQNGEMVLRLAEGFGGHTSGRHYTNQTGKTVWEGNKADFNQQLFLDVTGWTPASDLK